MKTITLTKEEYELLRQLLDSQTITVSLPLAQLAGSMREKIINAIDAPAT